MRSVGRLALAPTGKLCYNDFPGNYSASLLSADHSPRRKRLNCDVVPTSQPEDAGLWSGGSKLSSYFS